MCLLSNCYALTNLVKIKFSVGRTAIHALGTKRMLISPLANSLLLRFGLALAGGKRLAAGGTA